MPLASDYSWFAPGWVRHPALGELVRNAVFFTMFLSFHLRKGLEAFSSPVGRHGRMSNQPRRPKHCSPPCKNWIFFAALSSDPGSGQPWHGKAFFSRVRAASSTRLAVLAWDRLRWTIPGLWRAALQRHQERACLLFWQQGFLCPPTHRSAPHFCPIPAQSREVTSGAEAPEIPLLPLLLYPSWRTSPPGEG